MKYEYRMTVRNKVDMCNYVQFYELKRHKVLCAKVTVMSQVQKKSKLYVWIILELGHLQVSSIFHLKK